MRCRVVGHQPQAALVNTRSLFMPSPVGLYCILPPADAVHGSVNHVVNSTISPMSRDSRSAGQNKNSSDDFIFSRNKSTKFKRLANFYRIRSNGVRKTYKTRYACCFGTTREAREFGCHAVELRSLQETVFALGGRSFLTLMKEAAVDQRNVARNRTYFVPVDRSAPEATGDAANDVVRSISSLFSSIYCQKLPDLPFKRKNN